ncbi:MAG: hypothetical protein JWP89_3746 [Schlesneria sp.]|nr:hypothetical protein [Schlesneria sp.]
MGGRGSCRAAVVDGLTITCAARQEPRPPRRVPSNNFITARDWAEVDVPTTSENTLAVIPAQAGIQ